MSIPSWTTALCLACAFTAQAQLQPSLESMGWPLDGRNIQIAWAAPTNSLPPRLDVLKPLPASFSSQIVSNLIVIAELKDPAKAWLALKPATSGRAVTFQEPDTRKYLSMSPATGHISYRNPRAIAGARELPHGVPSDADIVALTLPILARLGIAESDLTHRPGSNQLERASIVREHGGFDKVERKKFNRTLLRGVILYRQVNGLSLSGAGDSCGVLVEFGNDAKVSELSISWPNLKPFRTESVADPGEIIQRIKSGRAVIALPDSSPPVKLIKKLTITKAKPLYLAPGDEDDHKSIYPYGMLTATADTGATNVVVAINCPILK